MKMSEYLRIPEKQNQVLCEYIYMPCQAVITLKIHSFLPSLPNKKFLLCAIHA